MGISGLLPALASITNDFHISSLSGLRAAIDVYCWLHKGVYSCSQELCLGQPTEKYINYCMHRIKLLQAHNVTPVVVFDGGPLPAKAETERDRRKAREEARARGVEHLRQGNLGQARECFQRAVDITAEMAYKLIKELKRNGIELVVAPYEADAQMAHLALTGYVDAVITEDSDLLAYGCPRVVYKMDKYGQGKEIKFADLGSSQNPSFLHFTVDMFRHTCIMAGCDYLESIPGFGVRKAHAFIKKYKSVERVLEVLEATRSHPVPADYAERFRRADLTFRYHRVYCPHRNAVVHLSDPPPEDDPSQWEEFLGPAIADELARDIARGLVDPHSKQLFAVMFNESPAPAAAALDRTPARRFGERRRSPVKAPPIDQTNKLLNYFAPASKAVSKPFAPPRATPTSAPARSPVKRLPSAFARFAHRTSVGSLQVSDSDEASPAGSGDTDDPDDCVELVARPPHRDGPIKESPPDPGRTVGRLTPSKRRRVLPPDESPLVIAPKTPSPPGSAKPGPTTIVVSKHFPKGAAKKPAVRQILNDSDSRSPQGSPMVPTPGSGVGTGVFVSPFVVGSGRLSFSAARPVASSFRLAAFQCGSSPGSSPFFASARQSSSSRHESDDDVSASPLPPSARPAAASTPASASSAAASAVSVSGSADRFAQHLSSFAYKPSGPPLRSGLSSAARRSPVRPQHRQRPASPAKAAAAASSAAIVISDDESAVDERPPRRQQQHGPEKQDDADDDVELVVVDGPVDVDGGADAAAESPTSNQEEDQDLLMDTEVEEGIASDDDPPQEAEPPGEDELDDDAANFDIDET